MSSSTCTTPRSQHATKKHVFILIGHLQKAPSLTLRLSIHTVRNSDSRLGLNSDACSHTSFKIDNTWRERERETEICVRFLIWQVSTSAQDVENPKSLPLAFSEISAWLGTTGGCTSSSVHVDQSIMNVINSQLAFAHLDFLHFSLYPLPALAMQATQFYHQRELESVRCPDC